MNTQMISQKLPDISGLQANRLIMTSREIAELTDKQHQHVKRDIERMLAELREDASNYGHIYLDTMNREQVEYHLDRELTETLLTGYSAILRRKVIARWRELESGIVPTTLSGALRLAAEQAERIEQQQVALTAAAPKIEFVDRYATARGSKSFREVCKLLGANEAQFRLFLLDQRIAYRLDGALTPYQAHIDAGRFEVKTGISTISDHAFNQMRFTPKGVTWIAGEWGKHRIAPPDLQGDQ